MAKKIKLYTALHKYSWEDIIPFIENNIKRKLNAELYHHGYQSLLHDLPLNSNINAKFLVWQNVSPYYAMKTTRTHYKGSAPTHNAICIKYHTCSLAEALACVIVCVVDQYGSDWETEIRPQLLEEGKMIDPPQFQYYSQKETNQMTKHHNSIYYYSLDYWRDGAGRENIPDDVITYLKTAPQYKIMVFMANERDIAKRTTTILDNIDKNLKGSELLSRYNRLFVRISNSVTYAPTINNFNAIFKKLTSKSHNVYPVFWSTQEDEKLGSILRVEIFAIR